MLKATGPNRTPAPLSNPLTGVAALGLINQLAAMLANHYLPADMRNNFVDFALEVWQWVIGPGLILAAHYWHDRSARQAIISIGGDPTPQPAPTPTGGSGGNRAWMVLLCLTMLLTTLPGCVTAAQPTDAKTLLIVNTEKAVQISVDAINTFLTIDDANRALMKAKFPAVHATAELLRKQAPPIIEAAWTAVTLYQNSPTSANAITLSFKLQQLESMAATARNSTGNVGVVGMQSKKAP